MQGYPEISNLTKIYHFEEPSVYQSAVRPNQRSQQQLPPSVNHPDLKRLESQLPQASCATPLAPYLIPFLFVVINESSSANPLEDCAVLLTRLIPVPALATIMRRKIIPCVARAVCGTRWLNEHQALVRL